MTNGMNLSRHLGHRRRVRGSSTKYLFCSICIEPNGRARWTVHPLFLTPTHDVSHALTHAGHHLRVCLEFVLWPYDRNGCHLQSQCVPGPPQEEGLIAPFQRVWCHGAPLPITFPVAKTASFVLRFWRKLSWPASLNAWQICRFPWSSWRCHQTRFPCGRDVSNVCYDILTFYVFLFQIMFQSCKTWPALFSSVSP